VAPKNFCVLKRTLVAETPRLRVSEFTLAPGDIFPLHRHNGMREVFYCLEGVFAMELMDPGEEHRLLPGQSVTVEPGRVHRPGNGGDGPCRYLLVQSGENFDFNPIEEE